MDIDPDEGNRPIHFAYVGSNFNNIIWVIIDIRDHIILYVIFLLRVRFSNVGVRNRGFRTFFRPKTATLN